MASLALMALGVGGMPKIPKAPKMPEKPKDMSLDKVYPQDKKAGGGGKKAPTSNPLVRAGKGVMNVAGMRTPSRNRKPSESEMAAGAGGGAGGGGGGGGGAGGEGEGGSPAPEAKSTMASRLISFNKKKEGTSCLSLCPCFKSSSPK